MKPEIGMLVHYVPRVFKPVADHAAFVTKRLDENTANLMVLEPDKGMPYGLLKVTYDAKGGQDTWHYPSDFGPIPILDPADLVDPETP